LALSKELPENRTEINQLAKKAVAKAGQEPASGKLYWLRLVRWALSSGKLVGFNHHLLLFLELLEGSDPKAVMGFLEGNERDRRQLSVASEEWSPVDLSRFLLIHLDCCMTAKVDGYSRLHDLESSPPFPAESKIA
jgi:hypothetical protein